MGCGTSRGSGAAGSVSLAGGRAGDVRQLSPGANGGDLRYNMLKESKGGRFHEIYELQQAALGTAAMGCVVRGALKKRTGEMFACKTFMVSSVPKKKCQQRILETLRNEIDLLRSLDHPNIVRAYESYEVGRDLHLVMELCRGGDLNARKYTEAQAADVVRQILSAILHVHQKGICHRDLKFENILWESTAPDAHVKLIDFGMSARFQEGMTMNERVGTVYTMSPEVLQGEYTKKADLWSVGCITFHLIAGEPPFECEEEVDTMRKLLAVNYYWPVGKKVSSEAKAFVYHLLKYDPRRRWTVEEAIASPWLKRFAQGGPDASPPIPPSHKRYPSELGSSTSSLGAASAATGASAAGAATATAANLGDPAASSDAAELVPVGGDPTVTGAAAEAEAAATGAGLVRTEWVGVDVGVEEVEGYEDLPAIELQPPIQVRMLSSMRDYKSYGALRRTALMVVAYNQSPEKLRELRNEFVEFDTEKNGKISRGEMQTALAHQGVAHEEIEELFMSIDVDRSGDIHYLEFLAATIEAVGAMEEERLRLAFERLDTDESGFITVANLKEFVGPSYEEEVIRKTLEDADAGKDGRVGWEQFLMLMRGRQGAGVTVREERKAVNELKHKLSPRPPPRRPMVALPHGNGDRAREHSEIEEKQELPCDDGGNDGGDSRYTIAPRELAARI